MTDAMPSPHDRPGPDDRTACDGLPARPALDETRAWEETKSAYWPTASYWWIDQVGGFLALKEPKAIIGEAHGSAHIKIHGRLSRRHAELLGGPSGLLLQAVAEVKVNGELVQQMLLRDGDHVRLGDVELIARRPAFWSTTYRLDLVTPHRWMHSLSGVLLLGQNCVLGAGHDVHLPLAGPDRLAIHWHDGQCLVRGPQEMLLDGQPTHGLATVPPRCRLSGSWGTMAWEPAA